MDMIIEVEKIFKQLSAVLAQQGYKDLERIEKIVILHHLLEISKSAHDFWDNKGESIASMSAALQEQIKMEQNKTQQLVESANKNAFLLQTLERITAENDAEQAKQGNLDQLIQQLEADYERVFAENQQKEQQIEQLKHDYQQLVDKLEAMQQSFEPMEKAHQANVTVFNAHFAENKAIWGAINDNTTPQQHVDRLVKNIESQLNEFDNGLKAVVEQKDKLEINKIKE